MLLYDLYGYHHYDPNHFFLQGKPQFLFANATKPDPKKNGWFNHQVSYLDAVIDRGTIHIFCPHLWNRALYLHIEEKDLAILPTAKELRR